LDHLNIIRVNRPWPDDIVLVEADVIDENYETTTARHDPDKLAIAIAEAYRKYRDGRRRRREVRRFPNCDRDSAQPPLRQ
jgi:hypothetical protein